MLDNDPGAIYARAKDDAEPDTNLVLCSAEVALIVFLRRLRYGSVRVKVQEGRPVLIERPLQTIRL